MQNYSETLPYRRVKYAILLGIIAIISIITMLIVAYIWSENSAAIAVFSYRFIMSFDDPNEKIATFLFYILDTPPWYVKAWFFLGGVLFFFKGWHIIILRYFGWCIAELQRFKDSARFASGGNARFAGLFEEFKAKKNKGLYFGRSLFSRSWRMYDDDDRHMLTIAGSRSGKGACAIIPTLLEWKGSVLCIDPKGTNLAVTKLARHKISGQHGVFFIDPFQVYRLTNEAACFNPLSIIDPTAITVVEDIRMISEALIPNEADDKNIHFTEGAKTLLEGYIVHVVTSGDYTNPTLLDVFKITNMTSRDSIDIHASMMANESCGELAQHAAAKVLNGMGTNEFANIVSTLNTNLKWLASQAFKETLSRTDFQFEMMKETSISVFVVIPPDLLNTHKRFLRLFVNIASSRYTRGGKAKVPGLFIIDECPALGYMEEIAKAYGELASYNLILWTFFQDRKQLLDIYGQRAGTFFGSSRAVQLFAIKDEDAEWAARMIGTRGAALTSPDNTVTTNITAFRDAGSVKSEIGGKKGKQYIIKAGEPSILLQRRPYFESFHFQKLALPDPDHPNKNTVQRFLPFYSVVRDFLEGTVKALTLPYTLLAGIIASPFYIMGAIFKHPMAFTNWLKSDGAGAFYTAAFSLVMLAMYLLPVVIIIAIGAGLIGLYDFIFGG